MSNTYLGLPATRIRHRLVYLALFVKTNLEIGEGEPCPRAKNTVLYCILTA